MEHRGSDSLPPCSRVRLIGPFLLALFVSSPLTSSSSSSKSCPSRRLETRRAHRTVFVANRLLWPAPETHLLPRTRNPALLLAPKIGFLSSDPKSDSCLATQNPIPVATRNPPLLPRPKIRFLSSPEIPPLLPRPEIQISASQQNRSSSPTTRNPTLVVAPKSDSYRPTQNPLRVATRNPALLPRPKIRFLSSDAKSDSCRARKIRFVP